MRFVEETLALGEVGLPAKSAPAHRDDLRSRPPNQPGSESPALRTPGGVVEVDARPSDAVNLAVLTGVPIRVDAAILDDPVLDSHPEWKLYPARLADLAAEERQRRA